MLAVSFIILHHVVLRPPSRRFLKCFIANYGCPLEGNLYDCVIIRRLISNQPFTGVKAFWGKLAVSVGAGFELRPLGTCSIEIVIVLA